MEILIILLIVIPIVTVGVVLYLKNEKKKSEALAKQKLAFEESCKNKGYAFKTIIDDGWFTLLVDETSGVFCNNYSGVFYNIDSINSVSPITRVALGDASSCAGQVVLAHTTKDNRNTPVQIGRDSLNHYSKSSQLFITRESKMRMIINELNRLMSKKFDKELSQSDFKADMSCSLLGQTLSIDTEKKRFCVRTNTLPQTIFDFDDLIDYWVVRDTEKITKFNFGDALIGGIVGGKTGAAIWGKDYEKICKELQVVLYANLGGATEIEFELVVFGDEAKMTSFQYVEKNKFADELMRLLKYIEKNKPPKALKKRNSFSQIRNGVPLAVITNDLYQTCNTLTGDDKLEAIEAFILNLSNEDFITFASALKDNATQILVSLGSHEAFNELIRVAGNRIDDKNF